MISAKNVTKSYNGGKTEALKGVSLDVEEGKSVVILGASGSGKSTLLSVLSGLIRLDGGSVLYGDRDIAGYTDKQLTQFRRENIGFIFQQYYLLPHLSVEGNVRLGADLAKNTAYREIIDAVGLSDKLKSKPSQLSGGEQQRACIARALAKNPRVLFSDEPTGALDERTGRDVLNYIMRLQAERGFTVITVTHNQNIAETADVVVKMNSGKIIETAENAHKKSAYEIGW